MYNLNFDGKAQFADMPYNNLIHSNSTIVGYNKKAKNLWYFSLNKAGSMVGYDQPETSLEMVKEFINALI